jgi:4-diphosphocytidyl-2-C-methyl-D-erythritol kinase
VSITVRAPAKINLSLVVGRPRPDGFHPLDTVYQAISLYDDVRVAEAAHWSVSVVPLGDVDVSGVPLDASNIVVRAGRALATHHGLDLAADIEIHKGIPVAGGLAGGSADAAATLVALDRLWDLRTSDDEMLAMAGELGSDVPFALIGGTAHGAGRGEIVTPVPDAGTYWWVVAPSHEGLSTPEVYRELDRIRPDGPVPTDDGTASGAVLAALEAGNLDALADAMRNDLQPAALSLRPDLSDRLAALARHCPATVMLSGSGPTVLGLAPTQEAATEARVALLEAGLPVVQVATGPVAGTHVVEYA